MAKGLGIVGLVFAILAIFVPMYSIFVIWLALLAVTVAALAGDRMFSIATVCISLVNVLIMSPVTLVLLIGSAAGASQQGGSPMLLIFTLIMFAAPIVGIFLNATGKVILDKPDRAHRVVLGN